MSGSTFDHFDTDNDANGRTIQPPEPTRRLVTLDELAASLGLPRASLDRMAKRGEIPSLKLGGKRRFNACAVEGHLLGLASREGLRHSLPAARGEVE